MSLDSCIATGTGFALILFFQHTYFDASHIFLYFGIDYGYWVRIVTLL
jgi:hypothetical protein